MGRDRGSGTLRWLKKGINIKNEKWYKWNNLQASYHLHPGFVLFWAVQIPWLFPWPFPVFHGLSFSFHFQKFSKLFLCLVIFFTYVIQLNRHKLWCPTKCASFALFNYVSLSYFVLALTSTVTNLPNIILQFSMNFHDCQLNSMTFQAWKIKFLNVMTFQVFHDLYEPCHHWDHHKPQFPIPETRGMGTSFWHNDFGESL